MDHHRQLLFLVALDRIKKGYWYHYEDFEPEIDGTCRNDLMLSS